MSTPSSANPVPPLTCRNSQGCTSGVSALPLGLKLGPLPRYPWQGLGSLGTAEGVGQLAGSRQRAWVGLSHYPTGCPAWRCLGLAEPSLARVGGCSDTW